MRPGVALERVGVGGGSDRLAAVALIVNHQRLKGHEGKSIRVSALACLGVCLARKAVWDETCPQSALRRRSEQGFFPLCLSCLSWLETRLSGQSKREASNRWICWTSCRSGLFMPGVWVLTAINRAAGRRVCPLCPLGIWVLLRCSSSPWRLTNRVEHRWVRT